MRKIGWINKSGSFLSIQEVPFFSNWYNQIEFLKLIIIQSLFRKSFQKRKPQIIRQKTKLLKHLCVNFRNFSIESNGNKKKQDFCIFLTFCKPILNNIYSKFRVLRITVFWCWLKFHKLVSVKWQLLRKRELLFCFTPPVCIGTAFTSFLIYICMKWKW